MITTMDIIPLIQLKKRKIVSPQQDVSPLLDHLKEHHGYLQKLYVFDSDGIDHNKPNLCLYQKLAKHIPLWVDAGSRDLGDIVDTVMAGATGLTIRSMIWPTAPLAAIREITENELFWCIDQPSGALFKPEKRNVFGYDGLTTFQPREQLERDYDTTQFLKQAATQYKVYAGDSNPQNVPYWKHLGLSGILVDITTLKEFHTYDL